MKNAWNVVSVAREVNQEHQEVRLTQLDYRPERALLIKMLGMWLKLIDNIAVLDNLEAINFAQDLLQAGTPDNIDRLRASFLINLTYKTATAFLELSK